MYISDKLGLFGKVLFEPLAGKKYFAFSLIWIFALYLLGIFLWGELLNWGRTPLDYFDWVIVNMPRFEAVRDALHFQQLPLHLADTSTLLNVTDRFFGIPDVITTPQMLLMLFVDAHTFALIDVFIFYTIATAGLFYFKQKFNLSLMAYTILFFLFNFNGYIQSHYSVGHATWGGYFLFPWFFILVFNFIESPQGWRWVTSMAFLLFYMLLAGSEHHFLWLSIFLFALGLAYITKMQWILAAIFASGFLGAIRLLPPVLEVGKFVSDPALRFFSGYQTSMDIFSSLLFLSKPINDGLDSAKQLILTPLFPWETDIFVGLVGGFFVLYFGVFMWLRDQNDKKRYGQLLLPALLLFLFAHGDIYRFTLFRIPFFASERVSARMIAVPLVLLIFISTIYFQEWINTKRHPLIRPGILAGSLILVNDLWSHLKIWRVNVVAQFLHHYKFTTEGNSVANHEDPLYITTLLIGLTLTIFSATFLLFKSWQERVHLGQK